MSMPQQVAYITPEEYLRMEMECPHRNEYFRGEIFAMTGGTPWHSIIKLNFSGELRSRLKGHRCQTFDSDLRIKCPTGLYAYPDVSVVCGELEFDDKSSHTVTNPTLLVEVLSQSSEAYDRGRKFTNYRTIPSFREYVLVSQDEPMIQTFLKNDDGTWILDAVADLKQSVPLRSLGIELPLSEVYDRIDFTIEGEIRGESGTVQ